VYVRARAIT